MTELTVSNAIRQIQRYLRTLSYNGYPIRPIPIDGIYAEETREAVSEFQRIVGLPATGIVDKATNDALFSAYTQTLSELRRTDPVPLFPRSPLRETLQKGDDYLPVLIVRYLLSELSAFYRDIPPLSLSTVFDEETEQAVVKFQEANRLPTTGKVDKETWNALVRLYDVLYE